MSFKRLNTILGWAVFAIALSVYTITMEKSASFWDCGEFIAAAYKLQVVHPPGAPLFLMLGRIFTLPFPAESAAIGVNFMSALATAFAALFVFWSTTIFAKRIIFKKDDKDEIVEPSKGDIIAVLGSGVVASFAFTFQDSQWFNAVEAEVYALSTCLTAAVFYLALKWSTLANEPKADRYLLAIFFIVGLSIGVHLLNLLVIPAIALLVYFFRVKKHTILGGLIALAIGVGVLLFIQYGIILELPRIGSKFEIAFVNGLGLPFNSGFLALILLLFLIPVLVLFFVKKNPIVERVSLGFLFLMIGYLSYMMVPIRSAANPPIDIWNPENVFSMMSYLNREQYGDKPLLYGPVFNADLEKFKTTEDKYTKGEDRYEKIGKEREPIFNSEDMMLFPRVWNYSRPDLHPRYRDWLGLRPNQKPTMSDNLSFFYQYQLDYMYWRYFMWNFAGRQNSTQGIGNADTGNWESGIRLADAGRVVQSDSKPDSLHNESVNHFFLLPFVFGLIGLIFHFYFNRNDALVLTTLFLLTGVAIIIYLNQGPMEPRERDYVYVGSFMAYAMWIGLAVTGLYRAIRELSLVNFIRIAAGGLGISLLSLFVMGFSAYNSGAIPGIVLTVILIAAIILLISQLMQKANSNVQAIAITGLIGIAPLIMGFVGWDDHNRNNLGLAADVGANYLHSVMPDSKNNPILFTEGDNDTYPLWYAQEVENVRPDIRIVNNSLLQADWYADQMRQHNGLQPGLEFTFDSEDYAGSNREIVYFLGNQVEYAGLKEVMNFIKSDRRETKVQDPESGKLLDFYPTDTFILPIDKQKQVANGLLSPAEAEQADSLLLIQLEEGKNGLIRDEYLILDLVQRYINERPIYFTSSNLPYKLGLGPYIRQEGQSYRLYPQMNMGAGRYSTPVASAETLERFKNGMKFGNIESGVFLEETGQRHVSRLLDLAANAMLGFAENNQPAEAREMYAIIQDKIFPSNLHKDEPFTMYYSMSIAEALFLIDDKEEGTKIAKQVIESVLKQSEYLLDVKQLNAVKQVRYLNENEQVVRIPVEDFIDLPIANSNDFIRKTRNFNNEQRYILQSMIEDAKGMPVANLNQVGGSIVQIIQDIEAMAQKYKVTELQNYLQEEFGE